MSKTYQELSDALDQLEQSALEHPEQLFPLSYIRSHLDLLNLDEINGSIFEALAQAVSSTFDADRMSEQDRIDILALIERLAH